VNLHLVRFAYDIDCTRGYLTVGDLRLATIEEPWRPDPDGPGGQKLEADRAASCVPDGIYRVEPHDGAAFQDVWALVNPRLGVYRWPGDIPKGQPWGRSAILIHSGNSVDDIVGCIAVGLAHERIGGKAWVSNSKRALSQLRGVLGTSAIHQITIRPIAGSAEAA
jgi:hypothetical protein